MGRKIDALLKRSDLKASKFKPLVNLALHRLAVLKNQRQVRCNIAKSDVVEILKLGLHDRALLRVEHVIKEQNMLVAFHMIEGYLNLVIERFHVIEQDRFCPDELKEAISSLLYAASRCGEFPELQEIKAVFTLHYGKEFAAKAIELRNNCGVSATLIQKLSTRMPSLESRKSILEQIANENGVTLQLGESSVETRPATPLAASPKAEDDRMDKERFFEPGYGKRYENAADAAQAAFESAAHAAQAARAAVELSRGDYLNGSGSPFPLRRKTPDQLENGRLVTQAETEEISGIGDNTPETEEAQADLKKSISTSSISTDNMDLDEDNASQTDKVDHNNTLNDNLVDNTLEESDDQAQGYEVEHSNAMNNPRMDIVIHDAAVEQAEGYEVKQSTVMNDPHMDITINDAADDQAKTVNSQGLSMPDDPPVNQAHEESWVRRKWNSKIEKIKRPFSHRSRGVATH